MVVRFALISSFLLHRVQSTDTQYLYHHPAAVRVSVASTLEVIYSLKDRSTDWPAGRSTVWVNWLDGEIAALFFLSPSFCRPFSLSLLLNRERRACCEFCRAAGRGVAPSDTAAAGAG